MSVNKGDTEQDKLLTVVMARLAAQDLALRLLFGAIAARDRESAGAVLSGLRDAAALLEKGSGSEAALAELLVAWQAMLPPQQP